MEWSRDAEGRWRQTIATTLRAVNGTCWTVVMAQDGQLINIAGPGGVDIVLGAHVIGAGSDYSWIQAWSPTIPDGVIHYVNSASRWYNAMYWSGYDYTFGPTRPKPGLKPMRAFPLWDYLPAKPPFKWSVKDRRAELFTEPKDLYEMEGPSQSAMRKQAALYNKCVRRPF